MAHNSSVLAIFWAGIFPLRGGTGGAQVNPWCRPLLGEKHGGGFGFMAGLAPAIYARLYNEFLQEVCKCNLKKKSGFIVRNFPQWRVSLFTASLGRLAFPCQKP